MNETYEWRGEGSRTLSYTNTLALAAQCKSVTTTEIICIRLLLLLLYSPSFAYSIYTYNVYVRFEFIKYVKCENIHSNIPQSWKSVSFSPRSEVIGVFMEARFFRSDRF